MNALIEATEAKQAEGADQGECGASEHEQGDEQGGPAGKVGSLESFDHLPTHQELGQRQRTFTG